MIDFGSEIEPLGKVEFKKENPRGRKKPSYKGIVIFVSETYGGN